MIIDAVVDLYDRIVDPNLLIRRITVTANKLIEKNKIKQQLSYKQLNLFTDYEKQAEEYAMLEREKRMQKVILEIKNEYGKNAILKGMNLEECATAKECNEQIGGHRS